VFDRQVGGPQFREDNARLAGTKFIHLLIKKYERVDARRGDSRCRVVDLHNLGHQRE